MRTYFYQVKTDKLTLVFCEIKMSRQFTKDPYPETLKNWLDDRTPNPLVILDDDPKVTGYLPGSAKQLFFQGRHSPLFPIMTYQKKIDSNLEECKRCEGFVLPEGKCKECNGFGQRPRETRGGDMSRAANAQKGTIGEIDLDCLSKDEHISNPDQDMPDLL